MPSKCRWPGTASARARSTRSARLSVTSRGAPRGRAPRSRRRGGSAPARVQVSAATQASHLQQFGEARGVQSPQGISRQQAPLMQMGEGTGHERVAGADRIDDRDRGASTLVDANGVLATGPVLAVCHDDEWDAGGVPDRDDLILGTTRIQPGQILLRSPSGCRPAAPSPRNGPGTPHDPAINPGRTLGSRLTTRRPASRRSRHFERGGHRFEHERDRPDVKGGSGRQRPQVLRQQSPIGRALRMEGVCRLSAATQMDRGQRRQIVGVDKVGGLHSRVSKLGAEHLAEGIAGQPGQKCRRHAEAAQTDRNVEARSARMRLVREMPTNRCRRREVDECVARDHDCGIDFGRR